MRLEQFEPVRLTLDQDPVLAGQYEAWKTVRTDFNSRIAGGDPDAVRQAWQRFYFRGEYPEIAQVEGRPAEHVNKRRLMPLRDAAPPTPAGEVVPLNFKTWSAQAAAKASEE